MSKSTIKTTSNPLTVDATPVAKSPTFTVPVGSYVARAKFDTIKTSDAGIPFAVSVMTIVKVINGGEGVNAGDLHYWNINLSVSAKAVEYKLDQMARANFELGYADENSIAIKGQEANSKNLGAWDGHELPITVTADSRPSQYENVITKITKNPKLKAQG